MTFENYREAASCTNEPIQIIPIHLQRCPLQVGVQCNGSGSCNNTIETCDDKCSYQCAIQEDVHTSCNTLQTGGLYRPDIKSEPTIRGSKINICEGMPTAGEISVVLRDSPGCDWRDDTNIELRDHAGRVAPGTELAKMDERHILEGRRFTYSTGFKCTDYPADFLNRDFWIESFTPTGECQYTLKGKDALGFFNFGDMKWPAERSAKLVTRLAASGVGSFVIIDGAPDDTEVICYNGEAIKIEYVRQANSGNQFRIVERAICGSTQITETAQIGEAVDVAGYLPKGTPAAQALYKFINQDGAGLPADTSECECGPFVMGMFDFASWREIANGCGQYDTTPETVVCKPTSVRQLVKEIAIAHMTFPIVDRDTGKLKLYKHLPPTPETTKKITQKQMVDCKIDRKKKRPATTKTVLLSHPKDCTKGIADENLSNNNSLFTVASFGDACNNPSWRPQKIKEEKTRFIGDCNSYHESLAVQRINYINRKTIQPVEITVHASQMDIEETCFLEIEHEDLPDASGGPSKDYFFVTQIDQLPDACFKIYAETSGFEVGDTWATGLTCDAERPVMTCPDLEPCEEYSGGNKLW